MSREPPKQRRKSHRRFAYTLPSARFHSSNNGSIASFHWMAAIGKHTLQPTHVKKKYPQAPLRYVALNRCIPTDSRKKRQPRTAEDAFGNSKKKIGFWVFPPQLALVCGQFLRAHRARKEESSPLCVYPSIHGTHSSNSDIIAFLPLSPLDEITQATAFGSTNPHSETLRDLTGAKWIRSSVQPQHAANPYRIPSTSAAVADREPKGTTRASGPALHWDAFHRLSEIKAHTRLKKTQDAPQHLLPRLSCPNPSASQATTQSNNMNDYDVSCASPIPLDFDLSFSEFASPEKIRQCEQMEMYPPGVVNEAFEFDQEPEQVKVVATQKTPTLQLVVEKQENTHPSPPTSPASSHHQTSKVRYTYWPRRVEHPLHIVTSGPLILEQNYSTSPPLSNTQKRRSSQQIKAMSPEQRKEEVRQRDRCHSATYNLRKKEKLVELEETLKIKKTQLNALNARNIALSSKLNIGSDMLQLLKNQINQKLLKKHQYQLREKEEAVKKLEAALEDIEVQEAHPEVKKSTLASRKSRTYQRYRTAKLDLEVFNVEVDLKKETLVAVELNKIRRKREVDSARREQENVGKLNGTGIILPGSLSHSKELQPPLIAKKEPRTGSQGFWTYSSKGRQCGTVSESPYYPTKLF
ncbi:unnamed protein product [Caenorhabditis brenneri]